MESRTRRDRRESSLVGDTFIGAYPGGPSLSTEEDTRKLFKEPVAAAADAAKAMARVRAEVSGQEPSKK